jgi:hypothetical protein
MTKPTYEEYKDIGNRFKKLMDDLNSLSLDAQKLHGKNKVDGMRRAAINLNTVRGTLDGLVFHDYKDEKPHDELLDVFYGETRE